LNTLRERKKRKIILVDANVIINLINLGELEILEKLKFYEFFLPNHVKQEVHRRAQRKQLRKAIKSDWIKEIKITDLSEN